MEEMKTCSVCKQRFTQKKNLYAHLRKFHATEPLGKNSQLSIECKICKKNISCQTSLSRHLKTFHTLRNDHDYSCDRLRKSRLRCPEESCKETLLYHSLLRSHLQNEHQIDVELEELTFTTVNDFKEWKDQIEQQTFSMYTLDTATKTLADGAEKKYYNCHRSYQYKSKGKNIRALKSMGTNKIERACPSRVELTISGLDESLLSVKFWKTHCGHITQIGRMFLDKVTRSVIAGKLQDGVSLDHILNTIRDEETQTGNRLSLLDRRDMHNIIRDYKIDYATKRHQNDAVSIKLWVKEMESLGEECPVLFYKGQDESDIILEDRDFALVIMTSFQEQQIIKFSHDKICMDGTHGTNPYDIHLYTLMTVDEFGAGCPVAFCLSNRADEIIFRLFFNNIKTKVGVIQAHVFMSDDAPAFYNAWASTMSVVPNRLLCTWHVDKNWRENLSKIHGGSANKALVYQTLRVLLEITSIDEFRSSINQVLHDLLSDSDTRSFGEYFQKHYFHRPECWAYCYRVGLGINTNMYLESFHKTLKHIYLEGRKVKRLDKTVNDIMKLARDSLFKRLIKLSKNSQTVKVQQIQRSHKSSELVNPNQIKVLQENSEWVVSSTSNDLQKYLVVKVQEPCMTQCLKCVLCQICIHTFKCTCTDNLIKMNICKHIHACARLFFQCSSNVNSFLESGATQSEIKDLLLLKPKASNSSINHNEKVLNKIDLISSLCATVSISDDKAKQMEKYLDKVIDILNEEDEVVLKPTQSVNIQEKIQPQPRLYSTKKKNLKRNVLHKPTVQEGNAIKAGLQQNSNKVLNIHSEFDHSYLLEHP